MSIGPLRGHGLCDDSSRRGRLTTASAARPLITLAVFAFNQERYIREAVKAALLQTYEPLEIILSDDCSEDQTFEILQEETARYAGPHTIVLNCNKRNLGICSHVNRVVELAHGELIVTAAGDDLALPNRVEKAFEAWDRTQQCADGLAFGFYSDVLGGPVWQPPGCTSLTAARIIDRGTSAIRGASAAWTRRLFDQWGPLPDDAGAEDQVLAFRAALSGGLISDPTPVVVYRSNPDRRGLRGHDRLAVRLWTLSRIRSFYNVYRSALKRLKTLNKPRLEEVRDLELNLLRRYRALEREIAYLEQGTRMAGLRYVFTVFSGRTWTRYHWKNRPIGALTILRHLVVGRSRIVELAPSDHHAPDELVKLNAKGLK